MDKEKVEALKASALRSFKMNSFMAGWCAAFAFIAGVLLIGGQGNFWIVFVFAMNAAAAGWCYREAFGKKGQNRVAVRLWDGDKEIL